MTVFDALLRSEPRLADATLDAFLRYARELNRKTASSRGSRIPGGTGARRGSIASSRGEPAESALRQPAAARI